MKRLVATFLAVSALLALAVAQVAGQDSYPPVYDATGAMQTAIGPSAQTGIEQDAATLGIAGYIQAHEALNIPASIPPVYDVTGAKVAAMGQNLGTVTAQDAATQGILGYIQAHETLKP